MIGPVEAMALFRREVAGTHGERRERIVLSRGLAALDAFRSAVDPTGAAKPLWELLGDDLRETWLFPMKWFPDLSARIAKRAPMANGLLNLAFQVRLCWWLDSFSAALAQGWMQKQYPSPVITPGEGAWRTASDYKWMGEVERQLRRIVPWLQQRECTPEEVAQWATSVAPMQLRIGWMALGWAATAERAAAVGRDDEATEKTPPPARSKRRLVGTPSCDGASDGLPAQSATDENSIN